MNKTTLGCLALLVTLALALGACGDDGGNGGTGEPDVPDATPDGGGGDVTPDTSPDVDPTDTGTDTAEVEDVEDTDAPDGGPQCSTADDCDGFGDIGACSELACVDSTCVVVARDAEGCCETVADCQDVEGVGACDTVECVDHTCEINQGAVDDCCETDADCAGQGDGCCNVGTCDQVARECVVSELDNCCETQVDCDDGNPATPDLCEEACVPHGCIHGEPTCDVNKNFTTKDFDQGTLQLLEPFDDDPDDAVGIHVLDETSVSPPFSLYFGDPDCDTYFNGPLTPGCELPASDPFGNGGDGVQLSVTTPPIELDPETGAFLGFWLRMAAEPMVEVGGAGGSMFIATDYLAVHVDDGNEVKEVWNSTDPNALGVDNTTGGEWVYQTASLTAWAAVEGEGEEPPPIKLRFTFRSDGASNMNLSGGERWYGAYVDDILVRASCDEISCTESDDTCPDDLRGCTEDTCTLFGKGTQGICAYQTVRPGQECASCGVPSDCGSDPCFDYACEEGICSQSLTDACCEPYSSFPEVTTSPEIATEGFEDGGASLDGWEIDDPFPDDNIGWEVIGLLPYEGESTLYFGDPDTQSYDADGDNPAVATIWTPEFELGDEAYQIPVLQFWLWLSTEFDGAQNPPEQDYDQLFVLVDDGSDAEPVVAWSSNEAIGGTTRFEYEQVGVDLSAWSGQAVRVGFRFDSIDGQSNTHGGVRIDELTVTSICPSEDSCITSTDCDDDDPCTRDSCDLGVCTNELVDPLCCANDEDCDDGNECTVDVCGEDGLCEFAYDENNPGCCSEGPWIGEWTADFESGNEGFEVDTDSDPVTWHLTTDAAASGEVSFNFSDPSTGTYENPEEAAASRGRLTTPPIQVPPYGVGVPYAEFSFLLATEWDANDPLEFSPAFVFDELRVHVLAEDGTLEEAEMKWISHYVRNTSRGEWVDTRVDLWDWRGETVQLVFEFDSGDDSNNAYAGPYIDDVGFGTICQPVNQVGCLYGGECEASDECFEPRCQTLACTEVTTNTPECCVPVSVDDLALTMEGEPEGWTFESCEPSSPQAEADATSVWQFATADESAGIPAIQGAQALYFGNGTDYGGSLGMGSCGVAETPPVSLDAGAPWDMEFSVFLDIEAHGACPDGVPFSADLFTIEAVDASSGVASVVFEKSDLDCEEYDQWTTRTVDLDAYAGKTVYFRLSFDSVDDVEKIGRGILVDDLKFIRECSELQ